MYFGCDFSGWYNFGKIVKIVGTRCHILKLECTKFDFGRGCAPDPVGGSYSASPDSVGRFKGPTSEGKKGKGREGKGKGGKERA